MDLKWSQNRKVTFLPDQSKTLDQPTEIIIMEKPSSRGLVETALVNGVNHVISQEIDSIDHYIESSLAIDSNPNAFFQFPLSTILSPNDVSAEAEEKYTLFNRRFSKSNEKYQMIGDIQTSLRKAKVPSTILRDMLLVTDETFTNAIYNAPFGDHGEKPERGTSTPIVADKESTLIIGGNDKKICVVCKDPYGSLHSKKILKQMARCFDNNISNVVATSNSPGAGIGTYLMYMHSSSMFLGTRKGQESIVALVFQKDPRQLSRFNAPKSIHIIAETL